MENQNMKTPNAITIKKRAALIAAIVCCIAMVAAGSLAYFNAQETAKNVITTGALKMVLHDETTDGKPFPEDGISGVVPATTVDKKVYVENVGNVDMYVRIALDKVITPAKGTQAELDFSNITLDIDSSKWTEKDGYYYYNRALKPGEKTEPLFTKVSFGAELGNDYMDAKVVIDVDAQAVQSKNNTDSALDAKGWPKK